MSEFSRRIVRARFAVSTGLALVFVLAPLSALAAPAHGETPPSSDAPLASDTPAPTDAEPQTRSDIIVTGSRSVVTDKRESAVVTDSIVYDDIETVAPDGSVAGQLVLLPGISAVEDGDAPRFVSIRGISPDLNQTTIDGITLATIGNDGEGSRKVNLQQIPSELSAHNDVYKTFTAEQDGAAIGGIVDIATRSAFGLKRGYFLLDGYGIYSSFGGDSGSNAGNGSARHFGSGGKMVYANRFGTGDQFGLVLTARYENRIRNSRKWWQDTKYYFSDAGKKLSGPDDPAWNGIAVPYNHSYGSYTNRIKTAGSSAKFEWKPAGPIYASILGFNYRQWESSTMNKNDFYTKNLVRNLTEAGGTSQVNSIYNRYRYDTWSKATVGLIGKLEWRQDRSLLQLRGGYTRARYNNVQPYVAARTYPGSLFLDWKTGDDSSNGLPYVVGVDKPGVVQNSTYTLSTAQTTYRMANEGLADARVDYSWNAGPGARGFGFVTGVEYRRLELARNLDMEEYKLGQKMNAYLYDPGYTPIGAPQGFLWVNYQKVRAELWPTFVYDAKSSAEDSIPSDYRYEEQLLTPYLSLHYTTPRTEVVGGVRVDHTRFTGFQPRYEGGVAQPGMTARSGGYDYLLPSLSVVQDIASDGKLRFSYSRTLGRPTPGNIAQPETVNCGTTDDGGPDCFISRGNPDLRPRRSDNLDVQVERYFDSKGLVSLGAFAKWIKDDIFTLTTNQTIDGLDYRVRQPMNAEGSRLYGIEFQYINREVRIAGQSVDPFFNVTWLNGRMTMSTDGATRTLDRMIYQPEWLYNAGFTLRLPAIDGAFRMTLSHRDDFLESVGQKAQDDDGRAQRTTVNMGLWHAVTPHLTFKYEIMNLFDDQPKFLTGDGLRYVSEVDDYGRGIFFHVILR
jgi:iron complex outermembrane recepter protein